nr:immunoglobulin light chain junction region [Macaca mulatta]MOW44544.1 immunoglobulin light chain junction region [Macaca mulatta]
CQQYKDLLALTF